MLFGGCAKNVTSVIAEEFPIRLGHRLSNLLVHPHQIIAFGFRARMPHRPHENGVHRNLANPGAGGVLELRGGDVWDSGPD